MKYNYIIFGSDTDYMRTAYGDVLKTDYAHYRCGFLEEKYSFLNAIYRVHTSPVLNKKISLPFRGVWNPLIFRTPFLDEKPICFIMFGNKRLINSNFIRYLRKTYPGSKVVLFCQDLIDKTYGADFDTIRKEMDCILSFDHADVEKYDVEYYPLVYSESEVQEDDNIEESDVYFVGAAKDRLQLIIDAYRRLKDAGLKCDFYIIGAKDEERQYTDEITYCNQMPYRENLKHVKKAKCLLEVMQGGGRGYTLRACEAIMYGKKMITNNPEIKNAPFYSEERIFAYNQPKEIDPFFVNRQPVEVDYRWKEHLSPLRLLQYIDGMI